jgi:diketogulonate reductase-like aldo/keto reductase
VNARSHSLKETPKAIRQSLHRSGLEYIDLYLLHDAISGRERRLQAYRCLLDARDRGHIRNVGVSNWGVKHLTELQVEGLEMPKVNQIEVHPWCQ